MLRRSPVDIIFGSAICRISHRAMRSKKWNVKGIEFENGIGKNAIVTQHSITLGNFLFFYLHSAVESERVFIHFNLPKTFNKLTNFYLTIKIFQNI
jgi:hypothetical protein